MLNIFIFLYLKFINLMFILLLFINNNTNLKYIYTTISKLHTIIYDISNFNKIKPFLQECFLTSSHSSHLSPSPSQIQSNTPPIHYSSLQYVHLEKLSF